MSYPISGLALLAGAGAGLAAMYLFDPAMGAKRRKAILSTAHDAVGKAQSGAAEMSQGLYESVRGKVASLRDTASAHAQHHVDAASDMLEVAKHRANLALGREREHHYVGQTACAIGSMALGAGLIWMFDPRLGRGRRAWLMDKSVHWLRETGDLFERTGRHLTNRMRGKVAQTRRFVKSKMPQSQDQTQQEQHTAPLM